MDDDDYDDGDDDIAVSRICKVGTKILPIIIGASGTIMKGSDQNLRLLLGHQSAIELQKVTLMSIAHRICKVLV